MPANVFRRQAQHRARILPTAPRPAPADNQTRQGSQRQRTRAGAGPLSRPVPDEVERRLFKRRRAVAGGTSSGLRFAFSCHQVGGGLPVGGGRLAGAASRSARRTVPASSASSRIAASGPSSSSNVSRRLCKPVFACREFGHGRPALCHTPRCQSSRRPVRRAVRRSVAPSGGSRRTATATKARLAGRGESLSCLRRKASSSPGSTA